MRQVAAIRDQLTHRNSDTSHALVAHTVTKDLPELGAAVLSLLDWLLAQT